MIMPQLHKYILRGCGIFVLVLLVSAKNGDRIVRSLCFVCREPSGYGSAALCFLLFLLFLFLSLFLLSFSKLFVDFQPSYYQEGEEAEDE
jgi:hypothetical protein